MSSATFSSCSSGNVVYYHAARSGIGDVFLRQLPMLLIIGTLVWMGRGIGMGMLGGSVGTVLVGFLVFFVGLALRQGLEDQVDLVASTYALTPSITMVGTMLDLVDLLWVLLIGLGVLTAVLGTFGRTTQTR